MSAPPPPRLARRLLARLLPARDRTAVTGDMDELFARRAGSRGRRRAAWWYRRQVAAFAVGLAAHAARSRSGAALEALAAAGDADGWGRDVRHGLRSLLRRPAFTLVAVASLALGIGANAAVFSLVNAVLLRGLPVDDPERWVELYTSDSDGFLYATWSYPDVADLRDQGGDVFDRVLSYELFLAPVERGGEPDMLMGEMVSGDYFAALGVTPFQGRVLDPSDDVRDASALVLSHAYWTRRFGADPGVVGRSVTLRGRPYEVVGVAEPSFRGAYPGVVAAGWVPAGASPHLKAARDDPLVSRGTRTVFVRARLAPDVGAERAGAWLEGFAARQADAYPDTNADRVVTAVPSQDVALHPSVDRALVPVAALLLAVVGVVLLIACVNLAAFLLARAEERRREVALRRALGAGRAGLVRRFLVETVLLAAAGGAGGLLLARWTLALLVTFQPPVMVPVQLDVGVDGRVLAFTAGLSLAAGLLFGLLPALQASSADVAPTLRGEGRGGHGSSLRDLLVTAQVAFSLLLLVGAGLFLRSLQRAHDIDPGFYHGPAGIVWPNLEMSGMEDETERRAFFAELEARLRAEPAVDDVALTDMLPLGAGVQTRSVAVPGVPAATPDGRHPVDFAWVSDGYFRALDVPVLRGRAFGPEDGPGGAPTAIVSEAFVQRFWPGQDALGRSLETSDGATWTVVGVARDTRVRTLGEAPRPRLYLPASQGPGGALVVVARGRAPSAELLRLARETARELRPGVVFMEAKTMEQHLGLMLFLPRTAALLLGVLGGLALLLAAIGIYGVVSYAVARRTREVGIRLSIGAAPADVVRLVVRGGMRLVVRGALAGLVLSALAGTLLSRFLYGVRGTDAATFVAVPLVLGTVAVLAAWIPARKAAGVDPTEALRSE